MLPLNREMGRRTSALTLSACLTVAVRFVVICFFALEGPDPALRHLTDTYVSNCFCMYATYDVV